VSFFFVVRSIKKNERKKIESPYFIFCEKRKSVVKIKKKYHVLKKRREKKKRVEIVLEIL
jgi:hypothetical protein